MMTRKKPWNRVNLPVYSICSFDGHEYNMNIATYITSVSMKPKRLACCVYQDTKTKYNIEKTGTIYLQLLAADQFKLIPLLGQKSGKQINKLGILRKQKKLTEWKNIPLLSEALAFMELKICNSLDGGDHHIYLCDVLSWKNNRDGEPLTLDILRSKKMIRI